jgi:hypothetical protein
LSLSYVVRPLVVGHAADTALREDEVLRALRAKGLITYPSPLLERLREELSEVRGGGSAAAEPHGTRPARTSGADVAGGGGGVRPPDRGGKHLGAAQAQGVHRIC